ncbi:MAG TPA: hypothetical protein V6D05_08680 [Stenomitos sp.]
MPTRIQTALSRSFELVDEVILDGMVNAIALGAIATGEALRHALRRQVQTYLWVAMAFMVGFGIWYILRVPETLLGVFGAFRR